jgi:hypothetical protein
MQLSQGNHFTIGNYQPLPEIIVSNVSKSIHRARNSVPFNLITLLVIHVHKEAGISKVHQQTMLDSFVSPIRSSKSVPIVDF